MQELTAGGHAPDSVGSFQIEPEARERLLRAAFVEQFGTNIAAIIQTNLARLRATNQPATTNPSVKPKRTVLQQLTSLFTRDSAGRQRRET